MAKALKKLMGKSLFWSVLCFHFASFADTTLIKIFWVNTIVTYGSVDPSSGLLVGGTIFGSDYYYSSEPIISNNNPFPDVYGTPAEIFSQVIGQRFQDVIGVPETMIIDEFDGPLGLPQKISIIRPFFSRIDSEVLAGLNNWQYDGSYPFGFAGYAVPPVSGIFNQAEQRFYVSDGRQYQVVPEPSSLLLFLAGGALLMAARRRKS